MDEVGIKEGKSKDGKVVGTVLTKAGPRKTSEATKQVSIIKAISAIGQRLTPVVIYKGKTIQGQWFKANFPEQEFTSTDSG